MKKSLYSIVSFVWRLLWRQILQTVLIIITISSLVYVNVVSITLSVLVWTLYFKLLREVEEGEKPMLVYWLRTILFTSGITVGLLLLFVWLGGFGIIGLILILISLAAWRIISNWKLYDAVTTWGAERIKGEHTEVFDIEKAIRKD